MAYSPDKSRRRKALSGHGVDILLALLLFAALWAPRVVALNTFVTIDEPVWLAHAMDFAYGLVQRDWAMTFRLEHPGVTTMWLAVVGLLTLLPDYGQRVLADPVSYRHPFTQWLGANTNLTPLDLLSASRWWVTLAVALTLTTAYFPLRRLLGRWTAGFCLLFLAWSPMAVAFARQLQPDGLLSATTLAALAFFLAWLHTGRQWYDLLLAGIMMGLAWLTKVPSIMLAPTGAVLIGVVLWRDNTGRQTGSTQRKLGLGYISWGVIATVTFFALWPVLWVDTVGSFQRILATMTEYAGGHANPNFFWGQVVDDPGVFFYPVAYLLRTTPAELMGLVFALLAWWQHRPPFADPLVRKSALGMMIFALIFAAMMTWIGKKFDRYFLPAFLALDVVAALGWVAVGQFLMLTLRRRAWTEQRWSAIGPTVAAGLAFVLALGPLHGLFTVRHYPYYMTYYNPLLGGAQVAEQTLFVGWGEGLEAIGDWLNQQPEADRQRVISWYATGPLSYFFQGEAISVLPGSRMPWLDADYVVLYINQIQRDIPTPAAVNYFLQQTPVYTVTSQGLTLARLYDLHAIVAQLTAAMPPPIDQPVTVTWPEVQLTSLESITSTTIASALPVQMAWAGILDGSRKVSLRLVSAQGDLVAQQDLPLTEKVALHLFVPPDAAPGVYTLFLMVYVDETLEPVRTVDGQELAPLLTIQITG